MEHLRFETIEQVDNGSIALAFNQALRQAFLDCEDRPSVGSTRKVTLEVTLKPQDNGYIEVTHNIKTGLPAKGVTVPMKSTREGLSFQPDAPDNPDQETFEFDKGEDPPAGRKGGK